MSEMWSTVALSNDSIDGGHGNDELRGDEGNDSIEGGFGVDTVIGGVGDDVLSGSAWSDEVFGGTGEDFINGGFGSDRVNGGDDADRFYHLGIADHGSDWIQDYDAADGDVLIFGQARRHGGSIPGQLHRDRQRRHRRGRGGLCDLSPHRADHVGTGGWCRAG